MILASGNVIVIFPSPMSSKSEGNKRQWFHCLGPYTRLKKTLPYKIEHDKQNFTFWAQINQIKTQGLISHAVFNKIK